MTADIHSLAGAYALDALPEDERADFEAHMAACEPCRTEVASLRDAAAHLADLEPMAPPPGLRADVMAAIDRTPQDPPPARTSATPSVGAEPRGPTRRRWVDRVGLAAAAVLVLVVGALGLWANDLGTELRQQRAQAAQVVAVLTSDDATTLHADGSALVVSPSDGRAVFATSSLSPPAGSVLQLWVIDEQGPASAGLVDDPERAELLDVPVAPGDVVGVTIEPAGGSPAPTSDPVAAFEL